MNEYRCPSCGHANQPTAIECIGCGLIFEKYRNRRNEEFRDVLKSINNDSLKEIKSKFEKLIKKYPDLLNVCKKFLLVMQKGTIAFNSNEFDQSIKIFKYLKEKFPEFTDESDRYIKNINEKSEYYTGLEIAKMAMKEYRYLDAEEGLRNLKEKYQNHREIDEYLDKIARYLNNDIQLSKTAQKKEEYGRITKGKILESIEKKASPTAKYFSGFGCLFISIYYLIAIALCFTIVGAIIGIPMFVGAALFQGLLWSVLVDGTIYKIECPICKREIQNLFKPKSEQELPLKCPSCKKPLIIRKGEVLHYQ
jgi:tetratricopeptide (TPR) repeat protein